MDSVLVAKGRAGLAGTLAWLDAYVETALAALPRPRALSLLEVTLFCLVEHLAVRPSVPLPPYPRLGAFAAAFAARPSALLTTFRSGDPEEFRARVLPREKRALGDPLGLTQFGVNLPTLFPGTASSLRPHHAYEGEQVLLAGSCAGFTAGARIGHQPVNRSDRPARDLEVGTRAPADTVEYPDDDLAATQGGDGAWLFTRRDHR